MTFVDFTKLNQREDSPLEAQEHLQLLIECAKEHAVYTMDAEGRIDYWNTGAQALFGYTKNEIIGQSAALLYTVEDRVGNELESQLREANERGSAEDERWHVRKDGTRFFASGVLTLLGDSPVTAGTAHGYAMIARDLTERKTAAESIRFQANLLDAVEQSVIATNLDGIVIYWNQFAQQLYGWTAQEALGRHIMELTTPEVMTEEALEIISHLRQGKSWTGEFDVQRGDGTKFPAQIITSPINDDKGTLIGIVGVSIDITERKRQEASLVELTRQLERQARVFNTTLSAITDFAYIFDREGRFLYANQALLDLWALKLHEAVGKNFFDLQYPDDLASRLQQQIQQVFDTRRGLKDETPYTSPTGVSGYYEYIFSPVFAPDGTVEVVAGSTRDISERNRVETALRESPERLQMAMNVAKIYSWEMNLATQQIEWSNNQERIIGFHLPSDFATANSFIHSEDREETVKLISQAIIGGADYESEFRLVNPKSGEIVWVRGQGVLVGNAQNSPHRFVGITQNITERKHTEILLDTQKQALEMVVGGSPLAEVLKYLTGIVEHQSAGSSIASILLLDEQGRLHNGASPSLPEDYVQAIEGIKADKSVGTCSAAAATCKAIITHDIAADPKWQDLKHLPLGLGLQAAWSLPIVAADKRVLGTFGTYFREKREPTKLEQETVEILAKTAALAIERKRAEEKLNASEERLRGIFEASRDGILVEDDERIVYVNQSYTHLFGYEAAEELVGKHVSLVISPEDTERLLEFGKTRVRGELVASVYEFKGKRKDGTPIEVEASVSASIVGGHSYITTIVRDITERKQAESHLRESEERFRAMFEQANVGIVQASFDGILLKVNPGFCKIVGYSEEEASGMAIRDLTHPADYEKEKALTRQLMAGEIPGYSIEKRFLRKNGRLVWGQMTATLVSQSPGEPFYMLAIVEDITERKQAEEALRISQAKLQESNDELERRVMERTGDLSETNAILQQEIKARQRIEAERIELLRRVILAQEDERRRIAREMHDQFGQGLSALTLKLAALKEKFGEQLKLREQLEMLEAVAKQLDADVDFLAWELRPAVLDDLGLPAALKAYVQDWSKHFNVLAELQVTGMRKERLTNEIETVLYRITQEALNNAAKHAHAGKVGILLEHYDRHVSLIIEGDGVGFDAGQAFGQNDKGLGLIGMRERAALVGGTAEIESKPDEGTTVFIRIPAPPAPGGGEQHG
ncbi:hypothetical protein BH18ACI4_BH18ACI4_12500 [soil metagenome]